MTIKCNTARWAQILGENIRIQYDNDTKCEFSVFGGNSYRTIITFRRFCPDIGWSIESAQWVTPEFINVAHDWLKKNLSEEGK